MESIGVKLRMDDYRKIFDEIDYDKEGEIGFSKFCLLNTDRRIDIKKLVTIFLIDLTLERRSNEEELERSPYHNFWETSSGKDFYHWIFLDELNQRIWGQ